MESHVIAARMSPVSRQSFGAAVSLLVLSLLVGCAPKTPSCSDAPTVKTVLSIFEEQMQTLPQAPDESGASAKAAVVAATEIRGIRTVAKDGKLGAVSCEGTLSIALPSRLAQGLAIPGNFIMMTVQSTGIAVHAGRLEQAIEYTAQCTDDGKQVDIKTTGVSEVAQFAAILTRTGEFGRPEKRTEKEPALPPEVVPAPRGSANADAEPAVPTPAPVEASASEPSAPPSPPAAAQPTPSFSCSGPLSTVEKMICDNPVLADSDSRLAQSYAAARAMSADAELLKRQQRAWRSVRDACGDVSCVKDAYDKRIVELTRAAK